jgi:hypothetical protein
LPIIYNTSAYDSLDSLQLMDGIVDISMPDFKVWSQPTARRYLRRPDYAEVARAAVMEMHRQVGPLVVDSDGLARRGLLLRHSRRPHDLSGLLTARSARCCGSTTPSRGPPDPAERDGPFPTVAVHRPSPIRATAWTDRSGDGPANSGRLYQDWVDPFRRSMFSPPAGSTPAKPSSVPG